MSPEQSSGERELDTRSDLYSLASVTYEMLAGEPPFTGPTAQAVIARRLSQPAPSLRVIRPNISESVDAALRRALAPIPADRFATTMEFARALATASSGPVAATSVRRAPSRRTWIAGGAALLALGFFAVRLARQTGASSSSTNAPASTVTIAVLPFRFSSADTSDRYLADGITEEVTSALANVRGLRVIDRASVGPYAAVATPARADARFSRRRCRAGRRGTKGGDSIRVLVRLIDANASSQAWSQQWNHSARDVFRVQSEVAAKVTGVLKIQLAERESRALARPPTLNPDAYDAYLRAQALSRGASSGSGLKHSDSVSAELTRAVQLDSMFAAAWGRLASELLGSVFSYYGPTLRGSARLQSQSEPRCASTRRRRAHGWLVVNSRGTLRAVGISPRRWPMRVMRSH
jgi:TolB-like protein